MYLIPALLKECKSSNGITSEFILPAKPIHVALYLACLVQQSSSPSPINQAFHCIRWTHNIASTSSPTDSDLVKNILKGAKRRLSVLKRKSLSLWICSQRCMIKCSVIKIYMHGVPLVPAYYLILDF